MNQYPLATRKLLAVLATISLAGCTATPPNAPVQAALPAQFQHMEGWLATSTLRSTTNEGTDKTSLNNDARLPRDWWLAYQDPVLNALMQQVNANNPSLAQASARLRQAEAAIAASRANALPQLGASTTASRSGNSAATANNPASQFAAGLNISWAPDLWGRIDLQQQAAQEDAAASAADLAAAQLALQLNAAQSYVSLRTLEQQQELLQQTLSAYERSLELTRNQYESGLVARANMLQAETQLQSVRTQITANEHQMALAHNILAALAGITPSELQLTAKAQPGWLTSSADDLVPPDAVPASLLLRRPDVASAERQIAAANARLGIAQTAWLPDLTLSANAGLQASTWSRFIDAPVRVWSLGPALAASIFDGGARNAATQQAQAAYDIQVAAWRASILQAVKETEDALVSNTILIKQSSQQQELVRLAQENLRVVQNQYEAGMISYLEVATAQNLALSSQRSALDTQSERLQANMQLIAALGGGWNSESLNISSN